MALVLTTVPTDEQYQKRLNELNSRYQKLKKDHDYHQGQNAGNQARGYCPGMRGFTGGMSSCDYWKMQSQKEWEKKREQFEGGMSNVKKELADYQQAVVDITRQKQQEKLDADLAKQQKILEDNIRRTFEEERKKFELTIGAAKANQIIPNISKLETIPKDEPLAILDKLEYQKQPGTQETDSNYLIIGGIGIIAVLVAWRFS